VSAKHLLYFTATDHYVYRWSRRALALEARFTADDAGALEFREYLRGKRRALFYLVADLAGEDFHEDQIPYLRGGDRQAVIDVGTGFLQAHAGKLALETDAISK